MTVSYSDVEGGQAQVYRESGYTWNWGSGNLDTDPLFADAANGDFHLKSAAGRWTGSGWVNDTVTSLCIDAGNPHSFQPFAKKQETAFGGSCFYVGFPAARE